MPTSLYFIFISVMSEFESCVFVNAAHGRTVKQPNALKRPQEPGPRSMAAKWERTKNTIEINRLRHIVCSIRQHCCCCRRRRCRYVWCQWFDIHLSKRQPLTYRESAAVHTYSSTRYTRSPFLFSICFAPRAPKWLLSLLDGMNI